MIRLFIKITIGLLIVAAAVTSYLLFYPRTDITVLFAQTKGLEPKGPVYLSGLQVGKVQTIGLQGQKVAVTISFDWSFRGKIPTNAYYFIATDPKDPSRQAKCVLIRPRDQQAGALQRCEIVNGIDSLIQWKAIEYSSALDDFMTSEPVQQMMNDLKRIEQGLRKKAEKIDWDQLGEQARKDMDALLEEFESVYYATDVETKLNQLKQKVQQTKQALENVNNSQEAQQLRETLDELYLKLKEELQIR